MVMIWIDKSFEVMKTDECDSSRPTAPFWSENSGEGEVLDEVMFLIGSVDVCTVCTSSLLDSTDSEVIFLTVKFLRWTLLYLVSDRSFTPELVGFYLFLLRNSF